MNASLSCTPDAPHEPSGKPVRASRCEVTHRCCGEGDCVRGLPGLGLHSEARGDETGRERNGGAHIGILYEYRAPHSNQGRYPNQTSRNKTWESYKLDKAIQGVLRDVRIAAPRNSELRADGERYNVAVRFLLL
jgi:hypothetical protein